MKKSEFYSLINELLEFPNPTLTGAEVLSSLAKWDSLAVIGFIALLDQHFGVTVPAAKILECRTVSELAGLVGDRLFD